MNISMCPQDDWHSNLIDQIETRLNHPHQADDPFAVCVLDIDQIPVLRQTMGEAAVTDIVARIGVRLQHAIRAGDSVAQIGTGTFALLLPEVVDTLKLEQLLYRLLFLVATPIPLKVGTTSTTATIGVAHYPHDARQTGGLAQCVDAAMAMARSEGGDGFRFFSPPATPFAAEWRDLAAALRDPERGDELTLHYQPRLDLRSDQIIGFEAVLRWQHPVHGLITPDHLIHLAEEGGVMVELSQWLVRHVLAQLRTWQNVGQHTLTISAKLSLRHVGNIDLPGFIATELAAAGVPPSLLELEISESAVMHAPDQATIVVDRLKQLGVRMVLDEFGMGLSSLPYLARLNVDKIKIDQRLIQNITNDQASATVVASIIAMAHTLDKNVVAVGVENDDQAVHLRRHECDEVQGLYSSRPDIADDMAALFASGHHLQLKHAGEVNRTLLLVDDEPYILSALKRVLRCEGYTIFTAESGAVALQILAAHPVQVIVSDQRMPGMAGVELLTCVHALYPKTRRIILSGYLNIPLLAAAVNRGTIWKYFGKPWDDETLRSEISHAFELTA